MLMQKDSSSSRLSLVPESVTLRLLDRIHELRKKGKKVILLNKGEPENPPPYASEFTKMALDQGLVHMPPISGLPELAEAIAETLSEDDKQIQLEPRSEIVITPGSKFAAFIAVASVIEQGDEVILPDPIFPPLRDMVTVLGGKAVQVKLDEDSNFELDVGTLERSITERTKMIILNYPNSPTGASIGEKQLRNVLEIARQKKIIVLADEIYEKIIFEKKHTHVLSFSDYREITMMTSGFTKTYGMSGWRIGYLITNQRLAQRALTVLRNSTTFCPAFTQKAAEMVMRDPRTKDFIGRNLRDYREKRDFLLKEFRSIDGMNVVTPDGSFYLFPSIAGTRVPSSSVFAEKLLSDYGVAVLPGNAFNPWWDDHLRISCNGRHRICRG
jgi:aspartate aminotransferase